MKIRLMLIVSIVFLAACFSQSGLIDSGKIYKGISKEEVFNFNVLANQFQQGLNAKSKKYYLWYMYI